MTLMISWAVLQMSVSIKKHAVMYFIISMTHEPFDAEKTIKDLIAGKIAVDEVDKKEVELLEKQRLAEERKALKKALEEKRFKKLKTAQERKQWGFIGRLSFASKQLFFCF